MFQIPFMGRAGTSDPQWGLLGSDLVLTNQGLDTGPVAMSCGVGPGALLADHGSLVGCIVRYQHVPRMLQWIGILVNWRPAQPLELFIMFHGSFLNNLYGVVWHSVVLGGHCHCAGPGRIKRHSTLPALLLSEVSWERENSWIWPGRGHQNIIEVLNGGTVLVHWMGTPAPEMPASVRTSCPSALGESCCACHYYVQRGVRRDASDGDEALLRESIFGTCHPAQQLLVCNKVSHENIEL